MFPIRLNALSTGLLQKREGQYRLYYLKLPAIDTGSRKNQRLRVHTGIWSWRQRGKRMKQHENQVTRVLSSICKGIIYLFMKASSAHLMRFDQLIRPLPSLKISFANGLVRSMPLSQTPVAPPMPMALAEKGWSMAMEAEDSKIPVRRKRSLLFHSKRLGIGYKRRFPERRSIMRR